MKEKKYVKPSIRIVELRNREKIAGICWALSNQGGISFYNTEGEGWVSFKFVDKGCSFDSAHLSIVYYKDINDNGTLLEKNSKEYNDYLNELIDAVNSDKFDGTGKGGNNFSGEGIITFPGSTPPSGADWS